MPPKMASADGSKRKGGDSEQKSWYGGLTAPIKELGSGVFANVVLYSLKSDQKQQQFAVKEIALEKLTDFFDPEIRTMIENELRLHHFEEFKRHPHIIPIYAWHATKTHVFVAMKYCRGGSLESRVKECKAEEFMAKEDREKGMALKNRTALKDPKDEAFLLLWILQLADAIDFLHSRRVSHRDVDPKNILIDIHAERPDIMRDAVLSDLGHARDHVLKPDGYETSRKRSDVICLVRCYAFALIGFIPSSDHYEGIVKSRIQENEKGLILGVLGGDECNRSAKALKCWPVFQGDNRNQDPEWSSRLPQGHPLATSLPSKSKTLMEFFADGDGQCSTREDFLADQKITKIAVKAYGTMALANLMEFSKPEIQTMIENELRLHHYEEFKRHPHIIPVYAWHATTTHVFVAMKYCRGGSLQSRVKACKAEDFMAKEDREKGTALKNKTALKDPKDEAFLLLWILQLADAIDFLHSRRVCHTDVTPGNILIDIHEERKGIIRDAILADLGTARDHVREPDANEDNRMMSDVLCLVRCYAFAVIGFIPSKKHFDGIAKSRIQENEKGFILGMLGGDECNWSAKALKCWPVFQGDNRNQHPDWSSRLPQGHPLATSRPSKSKTLMEFFADGSGQCSTRDDFLADPKIQKIAVKAHEKGTLVAAASPLMVVCNGESGRQSTAKGDDSCAPGTVYSIANFTKHKHPGRVVNAPTELLRCTDATISEEAFKRFVLKPGPAKKGPGLSLVFGKESFLCAEHKTLCDASVHSNESKQTYKWRCHNGKGGGHWPVGPVKENAQMAVEVVHLSDMVKVSGKLVEPWSKFHSQIETFVPTPDDVHMAELLKWEKPTKEVVEKIMKDYERCCRDA